MLKNLQDFLDKKQKIWYNIITVKKRKFFTDLKK